MQGPILAALGDSNATRASRAPFVSYNSSGEGTIYYRPGDEMPSTCSHSLACADKSTSNGWWKIWFTQHNYPWPNPGGYTVKWCDNMANPSGCWDVERVALHELGHVLGLGHNSVNNQSMTIMHATLPSKTNTGWQTHDYLSCDKARLQLEYDLVSTNNSYAECLSGLANAGVDGLKTTVTFSTSAAFLCSGESATFSGTLTVQDLTGYGLLGGNLIGGRLVEIERAPHGFTNFVAYSSDTTDSSGRWSRTVSTLAATDYDYRAHFDSESGLNSDNSNAVRVQWLNPC